MKQVRFLAVIAILVICLSAALYSERTAISDWMRSWDQPEAPKSVTYEEVMKSSEDIQVAKEPEVAKEEATPVAPLSKPSEVEETIPVEFNLAVPFTSQAPLGVWDDTHEETCEEASVYMVRAFYEGELEGQINGQTAENELQKIVAFENQFFGYFEDTTAEQTAVLAEQFYGYAKTELIVDPTVDDIKAAVAAGHPVIVPAAGRMLGNPYFTAPGPVYHMFVVRGYTKDHFITNDPGTRHGENYSYKISTVMNAMHDWNGGDVDHGAKVVLVVYPN